MPPAMKRLLANLQLPANRFDRRALVEVHLRLAQVRNDLLRRVSLPFHRVLPPSRAVRLSYQLVHLEGVRSLKTLQTVSNIQDPNSKVDRMWELLVEITLFLRNKTHRNPVEILKSFIRATKEQSQSKVSPQEHK